MSENTINAVLRRLGYSNDEMTAHGFRAMASTLLNESRKWNPDAIERALAHQGGTPSGPPIIGARTGQNGSRWPSGGRTISTSFAKIAFAYRRMPMTDNLAFLRFPAISIR